MFYLQFLSADSLDWVRSLPLGGYQMVSEPFDSRSEAAQTARALLDLWPGLFIRLVEEEDGQECVVETLYG